MTVNKATPAEAAFRQRMASDLHFYSKTNLWIRTKSAGMSLFEFNRAQIYLHQRLEKQLADTGKVRAMILKGRQQGCSTYVAARYYHKVTHKTGASAFILSHALDTSSMLFNMTRRFHDNCDPHFKQQTKAASSKELSFSMIDSSYQVGTAGAKEVARGGTFQFLHGSESSFWPNAESHMAGLLQAVPSGEDAVGSEIILESTANGVGNLFHEMWVDAESGESEFQAIFIPWYWQKEYREDPPAGWTPKDEDVALAEIYSLGREQIYWMHLKRKELRAGWRFKQEYPFTAAEAFQFGGDVGLIPSELVTTARAEKPELYSPHAARIAGCDPARGGRDKTAFAIRQGRRVERVETHSFDDLTQVADRGMRIIDEDKIDMMFIDVSGLGSGVYDIMVKAGYRRHVTPVWGNGSALKPDKYYNKRAEMWGELLVWFQNGPVEIPNSDSLHRSITTPLEDEMRDGTLKLVGKIQMRSKGFKSPDEGDAVALTFAGPVRAGIRGSVSRAIKVVKEYDMFGS